ncbi:hypothetical protein EVJ50_08265 [Synechococcus sp. RSCCF101]|uniref:YciI family protein n=1 Tax=Synechococcus sp. RSCCF101 TaxID=2511069 RepID=UPI001247A176|nr:YciI family protein [Synechococcus sp. RSCCF101]QEY32219.1 hypothetical protein EVJ50_08265 [Synechococcus sp. RSCCF101]
MVWFVKQETFLAPRPALEEPLRDHRAWVRQLQASGHRISSGYLVDEEGRPGGGGLMLFEAPDAEAAAVLVAADPMVRSGLVDWQLHQWRSAVGDLATAPAAEGGSA